MGQSCSRGDAWEPCSGTSFFFFHGEFLLEASQTKRTKLPFSMCNVA